MCDDGTCAECLGRLGFASGVEAIHDAALIGWQPTAVIAFWQHIAVTTEMPFALGMLQGAHMAAFLMDDDPEQRVG